jgi:hypothetical protein
MQSDLVSVMVSVASVHIELPTHLALQTIRSSGEPIGSLASISVKVTRTMPQITIRKIRSQFIFVVNS